MRSDPFAIPEKVGGRNAAIHDKFISVIQDHFFGVLITLYISTMPGIIVHGPVVRLIACVRGGSRRKNIGDSFEYWFRRCRTMCLAGKIQCCRKQEGRFRSQDRLDSDFESAIVSEADADLSELLDRRNRNATISIAETRYIFLLHGRHLLTLIYW